MSAIALTLRSPYYTSTRPYPSKPRAPTHASRHFSPRGQWLFDDVPYLAFVVHGHAQHRNHKPNTTRCHRLQHAGISSGEDTPAHCHLPLGDTIRPRLQPNVRDYAGEFHAHFPTAAIRTSISTLLPTQNGVR
jgi:hypothetical protein